MEKVQWNLEKYSGLQAAAHPAIVQRKMLNGAVIDPLEVEADSMADQVMQMQNSEFHFHKDVNLSLEGKHQLQTKPLASQTIKKKDVSGMNGGTSLAHPLTEQTNRGYGMDARTKTFMESRFGTDFSHVTIQSGSDAIQMSRNLNAQAFTYGNNIYFNDGKYTPETLSGKYLLAHELTHVIQQSGGFKAIQKKDGDDTTYAAKPEIDFKLLPPSFQFKIFHLLLAADTGKVQLDYHTKSFMTGLSYDFGDALSFHLKFGDFASKLGWIPDDNKFTLGLNKGAFSARLSTTPGQNKYGLGFHYGAPLMQNRDQMGKTFTAGALSLGTIASGLPEGMSDPLYFYDKNKKEIENVTKAVDLVKSITQEGKTKIRFGADFSLSYDPVNQVVVSLKAGISF